MRTCRNEDPVGQVTAQELAVRLGTHEAPLVVDVRTRAEFAAGHLPSAICIPFWTMPWRAGRIRGGSNREVVVYCGHGPRAVAAAAVLRGYGFARVSLLTGHMARWRRAGLPLSR